MVLSSGCRRRSVAFLALMVFFVVEAGPSVALATTATVPIGTRVPLTVNETVTPETHAVGQRVMLSVEYDVKVDGQVVIAAGAPAVGEVSASRKSGAVGAPAEVGIVVRTVTAVDGTVVPIQGTKVVRGASKQTESLLITILCCVLALFMKGEKANIIEGSSIDARVEAPTAVEVP